MSEARITDAMHTGWLECPTCGYRTDAASQIVEDEESKGLPEDGDLSICLACASLNLYAEEGTAFRLPTAEERAEIIRDPRVRRYVGAILEARERNTNWPKGPRSHR